MTYKDLEVFLSKARFNKFERKFSYETTVLFIGYEARGVVPYHIGVKFHKTMILRFYRTGEIEVNARNWHTPTTKKRLNTFLPTEWRVWQTKGIWHLYNYEKKYPFIDGMIIHPNGNVYVDQKPLTPIKEE